MRWGQESFHLLPCTFHLPVCKINEYHMQQWLNCVPICEVLFLHCKSFKSLTYQVSYHQLAFKFTLFIPTVAQPSLQISSVFELDKLNQ